MLLTDAYNRYINEYAAGYYKVPELQYHHFNVMTWKTFQPSIDADAVTPPIFMEWRDRLIQGGLRGLQKFVGPRCRTTVNRNHQTFMRAMDWLMLMQVISTETHYRLERIPVLRANRGQAPEPKPRGIVTDEMFERVVCGLKTESLRDIFRLMRLSGMRPGEACSLRAEDIAKDIEPGVWFYSPREHKTKYLGRGRVVPFGPICQEIITRFEAKKRLEPGPLFRNDRGNAWTVQALQQRLNYYCDRACLPRFAASQLRKTRSNEVFERYGLQGESATLGHTPETARKHYLMRDMKLAAQIARETG